MLSRFWITIHMLWWWLCVWRYICQSVHTCYFCRCFLFNTSHKGNRNSKVLTVFSLSFTMTISGLSSVNSKSLEIMPSIVYENHVIHSTLCKVSYPTFSLCKWNITNWGQMARIYELSKHVCVKRDRHRQKYRQTW